MQRRGNHRSGVRGAGALLALSVLLAPLGWAAADVPEYEVKAAFLYNFAKFVEWPSSAFPSPSAPIQICVVGTNPFDGYLFDFTRGKQVNGRPIQVRLEVSLASATACQIVYVSPTQASPLRAVAALAGRPVLTVGDSAQFARGGGIIGLSTEGSHVRFQINVSAARQANLKLSSQLLKVATQVIGQDEGK